MILVMKMMIHMMTMKLLTVDDDLDHENYHARRSEQISYYDLQVMYDKAANKLVTPFIRPSLSDC